MLYNSNATEQKQSVCGQEETHTMNQEQVVEECQNVQIEAITTYQKKEVRVVLEFPAVADPRAEAEFQSRLKEIYLRKIKLGSMQGGESEVQSHSLVENEEFNTDSREDKNYG